MTKRLLALIILLPVAIIIVALSIANRDPVLLVVPNFDGSALLTASVPLYVLLFTLLFVGMLIGSLGTWMRQSKHRRAAQERKVDATRAESEARRQRERADELAAEKADATPSDRAAALGLPAPTPRPKAA